MFCFSFLGRLRSLVLCFPWDLTGTCPSERTVVVEQLQNAPLGAEGIFNWQSIPQHPAVGGVSHLPPTSAKGKTPHRTCNSAQKSQGDLRVKAESTASKSVLEEHHRTSLPTLLCQAKKLRTSNTADAGWTLLWRQPKKGTEKATGWGLAG